MQICSDLQNCINMSIKKSQLPNELKAGDITAIFKKEGPLNKKKYRPACVLPTLSKIFERVLFDQLKKF